MTYVELAIEIEHASRALLVEIDERNQLVYDRRDPRVEKTSLALSPSGGLARAGER